MLILAVSVAAGDVWASGSWAPIAAVTAVATLRGEGQVNRPVRPCAAVVAFVVAACAVGVVAVVGPVRTFVATQHDGPLLDSHVQRSHWSAEAAALAACTPSAGGLSLVWPSTGGALDTRRATVLLAWAVVLAVVGHRLVTPSARSST